MAPLRPPCPGPPRRKGSRPPLRLASPQAGTGEAPIRRPVCGSHHHCHQQGCSPQESLHPHPCLRRSPSPSTGTQGVRRCRPPCSVPPSPAPGTQGKAGRKLKTQAQKQVLLDSLPMSPQAQRSHTSALAVLSPVGRQEEGPGLPSTPRLPTHSSCSQQNPALGAKELIQTN